MDLFAEKPADGPKALSVTQLVRRMKNLLEIELGEVWVEGEVSNLRRQSSGHWYFSLKDERAQISCAMFSAARRKGSEVVEDGARVRVFAEPSVYEARGQLQIIVSRVEPVGAGELQARFEALKRKLEAEGLFQQERKQELPEYPAVVGLITSGTGAAIRDMANVLGRRAPWVQPVLFPVRVQGKGAELEIAEAIRQMGEPEAYGLPRCDVLIVGRGGGSLEDLWNFNEEVLARAIEACPLPVVSAVGHETDFTIADFVADLRAPTPSAAAELVVPDARELSERAAQLGRRMKRRAGERVERFDMMLGHLRRGVLSRQGDRILREPSMRLDGLRERLNGGVEEAWVALARAVQDRRVSLLAHRPERRLMQWEDQLQRLERRLNQAAAACFARKVDRMKYLRGLVRTLGPESAFERGFSIAMNEDGQVIRSVKELRKGVKFTTKLRDGEVQSQVE